MAGRARWGLAVAAVVVAVAAGVLAWRALRPAREAVPADFKVTAPAVESKDMAVVVDEVEGLVRQGRTEWHCRLRCREAGGCHARLLVTVHYQSAGRERSVTFADAVNVERGAVAVLRRQQRPPEAVDSIQRVRVLVEQRLQEDGSGSIVLQ